MLKWRLDILHFLWLLFYVSNINICNKPMHCYTARTMKCATHNFFYTQKNQQWRTDVLNEPTLLHFQPQFVFFGSPLKITMKHNHQDNPYKVKSVLPAWVLGSKTNTQWTMLQPTKTFFKPPPLSNHLPGYPCCWKKI